MHNVPSTVLCEPVSTRVEVKRLGLLGTIDNLLVYVTSTFVSSFNTFPNSRECDLHGYVADLILLSPPW